jgi:hypothetical protein
VRRYMLASPKLVMGGQMAYSDGKGAIACVKKRNGLFWFPIAVGFPCNARSRRNERNNVQRRVRHLKPSDCCVGFGVDFVACRQGRVSEGRLQIGLATLADSTIHSIVPYLESRAGLTLVVTCLNV